MAEEENAASGKAGAGVPASAKSGMREKDEGPDCASCPGCCGNEEEEEKKK